MGSDVSRWCCGSWLVLGEAPNFVGGTGRRAGLEGLTSLWSRMIAPLRGDGVDPLPAVLVGRRCATMPAPSVSPCGCCLVTTRSALCCRTIRPTAPTSVPSWGPRMRRLIFNVIPETRELEFLYASIVFGVRTLPARLHRQATDFGSRS